MLAVNVDPADPTDLPPSAACVITTRRLVATRSGFGGRVDMGAAGIRVSYTWGSEVESLGIVRL
jgi:hypothetical protein